MHTVKVFNDTGKVIPTNIEIDGKLIGCRSIDYHADLESVPGFTFEIEAITDIEVNHAGIQFRFDPQTVVDAVKILRHELMNDEVLRSGFTCSIASALKEFQNEKCEYGLCVEPCDPDELAETVLRRMIGGNDTCFK